MKSQVAFIVLLDLDPSLESPDGVAASLLEDLQEANYPVIGVHPWKRDDGSTPGALNVLGSLVTQPTIPPTNVAL